MYIDIGRHNDISQVSVISKTEFEKDKKSFESDSTVNFSDVYSLQTTMGKGNYKNQDVGYCYQTNDHPVHGKDPKYTDKFLLIIVDYFKQEEGV